MKSPNWTGVEMEHLHSCSLKLNRALLHCRQNNIWPSITSMAKAMGICSVTLGTYALKRPESYLLGLRLRIVKAQEEYFDKNGRRGVGRCAISLLDSVDESPLEFKAVRWTNGKYQNLILRLKQPADKEQRYEWRRKRKYEKDWRRWQLLTHEQMDAIRQQLESTKQAA